MDKFYPKQAGFMVTDKNGWSHHVIFISRRLRWFIMRNPWATVYYPLAAEARNGVRPVFVGQHVMLYVKERDV